MKTFVNGERRQRFNTRDLVFTFGEYLKHLSRDITFYPGDIVSGGTLPERRQIQVICCRTTPRHRGVF